MITQAGLNAIEQEQIPIEGHKAAILSRTMIFRQKLGQPFLPAEVDDLVKVLSDGAPLLALVDGGGGEDLGHALATLEVGARRARQLADLLVEGADWARPERHRRDMDS